MPPTSNPPPPPPPVPPDFTTDWSHLERAARALAVRTTELDNRDLASQAAAAEAAATRLEFHNELIYRERALIGREAAVREALSDEIRLRNWEASLKRREVAVAQGIAMTARALSEVEAREAAVREMENGLRGGFSAREMAVARREAAVGRDACQMKEEMAEWLLRVEAERMRFWSFRRRLSAVVANEVDDLTQDVARLKKEFDQEKNYLTELVRDITDTVVALKATAAGVSARHAIVSGERSDGKGCISGG